MKVVQFKKRGCRTCFAYSKTSDDEMEDFHAPACGWANLTSKCVDDARKYLYFLVLISCLQTKFVSNDAHAINVNRPFPKRSLVLPLALGLGIWFRLSFASFKCLDALLALTAQRSSLGGAGFFSLFFGLLTCEGGLY